VKKGKSECLDMAFCAPLMYFKMNWRCRLPAWLRRQTRARAAGVDVRQSLITITQQVLESGSIWRVNYGPKDYVGRRGGDFIVEVDPTSAQIKRVLRGQ
jgi:hypothetical protein